MKTRNTIITFIVLAALGTFIWVKERHSDDFQKRSAARSKVFDFDTSKVSELAILNASGIIVAKKEGLRWMIVEPLTVKGDQFEIESMIQMLNSLKIEREINPKEIPTETLDKELQLKKPEYILSWTAANDRYSLRIGAETPMGNGIFVQKDEDGPVYIVSQYARETLVRDLSQLRDREIFPFEEDHISQVDIRISSPSNPYQIQFIITNGISRIAKPINARANQEKIANLVRFLVDSRAMDFVSEGSADLITYGLSEPDLEVTLHSTTQEDAKTLFIGNPVKNDPGKHYAKLKENNSVFTVTTELYKELTQPLNYFRDPKLVDRFPHELASIVIQTDNKELTLVEENNQWYVKNKDGVKADPELIYGLLDQLMNTPILSYVTDAPESLRAYGLEPPRSSVTLLAKPKDATEEASPALRIDFGKAEKSGMNAKRSDEIFIYKIPADHNQFINANSDFFINRNVVTIAPQDILKIQITRQGNETIAIERGNNDQKWQFHDDAQGVLNLERLNTLLLALQNFRATSAQSISTPPKEMANPMLTVTITLDNGEKTIMKFGKADKNNQRNMILDGGNILYQMDESVYQLLDKELMTRAAP